jgi:hypothetical protein
VSLLRTSSFRVAMFFSPIRLSKLKSDFVAWPRGSSVPEGVLILMLAR